LAWHLQSTVVMATLQKLAVTIVVMVAAANLGSSCDDDYSCYGACHHLLDCEQEWLADEGRGPMSERAEDDFLDDCLDDCADNGEYDDMECIEDASCDQLADGKCR
jgi:hypothetical protein